MKHNLYLILGTSGSGKSTVAGNVFEQVAQAMVTRPRREGEPNVTSEQIHTPLTEYKEIEDKGQFVQSVEYCGNYYGVTKEEVEKKLLTGDTYAVVALEGYKQFKKAYPNAIGIFIYVTESDLDKNFSTRTDDLETLQKRKKQYKEDLKSMEHADYIVDNKYGQLGKTLLEVKEIVEKTGGTVRKDVECYVGLEGHVFNSKGTCVFCDRKLN